MFCIGTNPPVKKKHATIEANVIVITGGNTELKNVSTSTNTLCNTKFQADLDKALISKEQETCNHEGEQQLQVVTLLKHVSVWTIHSHSIYNYLSVH